MPIDKVLNWVPRLGDVRLLTLNLWQRYGARADRRSVLIEGIRALEPDLLAFHESIKTDEYEKVTDLVGPGFNVVLSKGRHPSGMGISIASRWPLGMVMKIRPKRRPDPPVRGTLARSSDLGTITMIGSVHQHDGLLACW